MTRKLFALAALLFSLHALAQEPKPPYRDASLPVEARVDDLSSRMTLEEKVGQMAQINLGRLMGTTEMGLRAAEQGLFAEVLGRCRRRFGALGWRLCAPPEYPSAWAETTNALQRARLPKGAGTLKSGG